MGIEFVEIEPTDQTILKKWLAGETPVKDISTTLILSGLFLLVGAAVVAAVALVIF
jgi:hypothetical protein